MSLERPNLLKQSLNKISEEFTLMVPVVCQHVHTSKRLRIKTHICPA